MTQARNKGKRAANRHAAGNNEAHQAKTAAPTEFPKPAEAAAEPPHFEVAVSLHPMMSFELRCPKEHAPGIRTEWRWSYQGHYYYIKIMSATENANEPGRVVVVGGVFFALNPLVALLPEAHFLRNAFTATIAPAPQQGA